MLEPIIIKKAPIIQNQTYEEVRQFFPNMKFNHKEISYSIGNKCDTKKQKRMKEAFEELSSKVGLIKFYEVLDNADIEVICEEEKRNIEEEYFIAGEGGAREIIPTGRYNIISGGTVILHGNPHGFLECNWANVELHELIHVFGFNHSENPNSLMYPYLESCEQQLDETIIDKLIELYSIGNFPDLYFEDVEAVQKRKYLDFNLTIKNSGAVDARNAKFSVFEDDELIQTFDLGDEEKEIKYGAGIFIKIENLKLKSANPYKISFVIDSEDLIKEVDEENNIARIEFLD